MATLQGKAVKNTYRQVLQIGASNVGVSGTLQPVQDGAGVNTALSLSTGAATVTGDLTITGDLIITGGGIQITDLIDDTVATLIQNGTGITWAYNDTLRTLTPTITIATADGGAQADYLQLNTGANEASAVGKLKWNSTDGTMDIGLMGGQVTLQVGQEQVARVLNNSGSILTEAGYQAVKISSAQGQRLAVTLAQANNEANSTQTLGLVTENIANNQEGFVTTSGLIRQIDTTGDLQSEVWVDGDILYLSPTIPGGVTKVKPLAPQQTVIVGFVVYAHKNNGKIFVKVDNGYELDELHNVRITNVADNNILQYNSALSVWENADGTTTNIAEGTNLYYTQGRFDSAFAAKSTTNLAEGTNLYYTETRATNNFDTNLAASTTTDLAEGTNLYFTNSRARLALDVTAGTGISYNNGTGVFALGSIPNSSLTNSSVTINSQALALGGSVTLTTSDIAEGTNLYWTNARFDSRFGTKTTTDLAEGTNLYYTQARFNTAFDAKTTTDLDEGTNLYYTDARARAAFSENATGLDYSSGSGILSLTSGYAIPTTVKLGEYDTAYNRSIVSAAVTGTGTKTLTLTEQDANTITATWTDQGITTINGTANQIAASTVGNTTTVGFTNDVTFPNNVVVSGNLTINGTATYVNTQSISSKDPLFEVANDNNTTDAVDIGYYGRYFDSAQTRVEFTGLFRDASDAGKYKIFSGLVDEPTNVVDTTGTGYTVGTLVANVEGNLAGTANAANVLSTARSISATGDAAWTVSFDGSANATGALTLANTGVTATTYGTSTSVPTIAVDGKGRITSASNTSINFPVTTVNSYSGTVVLTTSDIAEGTNQYFTSARAQASITGGASSVVTADLTASRALVSDGTGKIAASASTTATELSYVAGVTSAIQTQINSKLNLSGGTLTGALSGTSATFSGTITSGTGSGNTLSSGSIDVGKDIGLAATQGIVVNNARVLAFASTGAATFSSSVTAASSITSTSGDIYATDGTRTNYLGVSTGSNIGIIGMTSNHNLTFITNNTERMRITSGGNVGIGTGTPTDLLTLYRNGNQNNILSIYNGTSGYASNIKLIGTDDDGARYNTIGSYTNGGTTHWSIGGGSVINTMVLSTGGTERMRITSGGAVAIGKSDQSGNAALTVKSPAGGNTGIMIIEGDEPNNGWGMYAVTTDEFRITRFTNGSYSDKLAITSGGNVLIGTTSAGTDFTRTACATSGANVIGLVSTDDSSGAGFVIFRNSATSFIGGISRVGTTNAVNYATSSDYRLKEDLKEIKGLEKLSAIKVYDFKWKDNDARMDGVLAHELQEILPYAVSGEKDEIDEEGNIKSQAVDYSKIVPVLVKAIQELEARVKELEAK